MAKIHAPFTDEQVKKLQAWQEGNTTYLEKAPGEFINLPRHPFTCCDHDGCTRPDELLGGVLIPTTNGWVCPCGKYTQDWCHDFMIGQEEQEPEPPGKSLYKHVIDILKISAGKGFPDYNDYIELTPVAFWRQDELKYCAIVCAAIQLWLRRTHNIIVWVEPIAGGRWVGYVDLQGHGGRFNERTKLLISTQEEQLLKALNIALNALPYAG